MHPVDHAILMVFAFIAAVLIVTTAYAFEVGPGWQGGGHIDTYIRKVNELNLTLTPVRITAPSCSSACTFFLGADTLCIGAETRFNFHGARAFIPALLGIPITTANSRKADQILAENYNIMAPGLGDWYLAGPAKHTGYGFTTVTGAALHERWGFPLCEKEQDQ